MGLDMFLFLVQNHVFGTYPPASSRSAKYSFTNSVTLHYHATSLLHKEDLFREKIQYSPVRIIRGIARMGRIEIRCINSRALVAGSLMDSAPWPQHVTLAEITMGIWILKRTPTTRGSDRIPSGTVVTSTASTIICTMPSVHEIVCGATGCGGIEPLGVC